MYKIIIIYIMCLTLQKHYRVYLYIIYKLCAVVRYAYVLGCIYASYAYLLYLILNNLDWEGNDIGQWKIR